MKCVRMPGEETAFRGIFHEVLNERDLKMRMGGVCKRNEQAIEGE